jgi:hypothetical protein
MRRVYALLGLARKYGDVRMEQACATALAAEMIDVKRLRRMLELGRPPAHDEPGPQKTLPFARHLRPPQQYALSRPRRDDADPMEDADESTNDLT